MRKKKTKRKKNILVARSKFNSTENTISKALKDNEISHEDFKTITNEEKTYRELKKSIRKMESQGSGIERDKVIEDGKRMGTDKTFKQNNNLRSQV